MFAFAPPKRRRKPSLTPMIDVVFLLLVFFMLASQFGRDAALPLALAGGGGDGYDGPPRLIDIGRDDLRLNGVVIAPDVLPETLRSLMQGDDDMIILRSAEATTLQRLINVTQSLQQAGFTRFAVVE